MGVGELIEEIRALYVASLQEALVARNALQVEPVSDAAPGDATTSGVSALRRRYDGTARVQGASQEAAPFNVDSEGVLGFEPVSFAWGETLNVRLTPFCWDFAEFVLPTAGTKDLEENLADWHARWFTATQLRKKTPKASRKNSEEGLGGVLHALSDVRTSGEFSCFQVDFGSAPLACFEDLLDVLAASRAGSVTVREAA